MASVVTEVLADWWIYFSILGLASFAVFWFLGARFFAGKLIIAPFFFLVLAMIGFMARKTETQVKGV